jgi:riboflavin synthase
VFTGLVTAVGEVRRVEPREGGLDLTIAAPYAGVEPGESIAVAGACLTVTSVGDGWFAVHAIVSTLARTRFGALRPGDRVNLERAVRAGSPLGGHLVQGHVDGVGQVAAVRQEQDARLVDIAVPGDIEQASIPLGSITVEGVSLTVNAMPGHGIIQVALVPYTLEQTTLGALGPRDAVHLEGDVIGKYIVAFLERGGRIQDSGSRIQGATPHAQSSILNPQSSILNPQS